MKVIDQKRKEKIIFEQSEQTNSDIDVYTVPFRCCMLSFVEIIIVVCVLINGCLMGIAVSFLAGRGKSRSYKDKKCSSPLVLQW